MPDLSATATIDLWEAAERLAPVERSLALAAAADASAPDVDELARLPLGRRDARLLGLHAALAGWSLEATAPCPACGEQGEFAVDASALLAQAPETRAPVPVEADGFVVVWRPPDSRDVAAAASAGDAAAAESVLLGRCVTAVHGPDGEIEAAALPTEVRDAVSRAMGDADPLAEVLVNVACPSCETVFIADVDVGGFVWAEVQALAQRLLREVDALARAYGWTEAEVLGLGERRRAAYLELAR
ncbi:MAG TPA: hypothetical protein VGJ25_11545 [Gaiellaceae bacterium]|jgi:hypothetical protein